MKELLPLLSWWLHEMRDLVEAVMARMAPRLVMCTVVRVSRSSLSIWAVRGANEHCVLELPAAAIDDWPTQLPSEVARQGTHGMRATVALAPHQVLFQELTFPLAVERELDRAIELHLERDFPLQRGLCYVERRVVRRDRAARRITIELLFVRTQLIDRLRERVSGWGMRLTRVGVVDREGRLVGNFVPRRVPARLLRLTSFDFRLAVAAAAIAVMALGMTTGQWVYERIQVGREVRAVSARAAQTEKLRRQYEQQLRPAAALARILSQPDSVDALATLTARVPVSSWAYELAIERRPGQAPEIKLSGFTPAAPELVEVLEESQEFEHVRLVSATSAGVGTGRDRLQLVAKGLKP